MPLDQYGRSPAAIALDDMKALNALPEAERIYAAARFTEARLAKEAESEESSDAA